MIQMITYRHLSERDLRGGLILELHIIIRVWVTQHRKRGTTHTNRNNISLIRLSWK